jgi:hypothetical protein
LVPALRPRRPEEPDCFVCWCVPKMKNDFKREDHSMRTTRKRSEHRAIDMVTI